MSLNQVLVVILLVGLSISTTLAWDFYGWYKKEEARASKYSHQIRVLGENILDEKGEVARWKKLASDQLLQSNQLRAMVLDLTLELDLHNETARLDVPKDTSGHGPVTTSILDRLLSKTPE